MSRILALLLSLTALGLGAVYLLLPKGSPGESCRAVLPWARPGTAGASLNHPMGLAWDGGVLYVADAENGAIKLFRSDGSLVSEWRGFQRPVALAVTERAVYVADFLADRISVLNRAGVVIRRWGSTGRRPGEFDAPSGIAVDSSGDVYITDFYNHRVQRFTADGRFLSQWGERGRLRGQFRYPTGSAVSGQDRVIVADGFNHRVQIFTPDGRFLDERGGIGYGIGGKRFGWFRLANHVAVDPRGDLYATDSFNRRVQKFRADGEFLAAWNGSGPGAAALRYPAGVVVDDAGDVYVSDFFGNEIRKFTCDRSGAAASTTSGITPSG